MSTEVPLFPGCTGSWVRLLELKDLALQGDPRSEHQVTETISPEKTFNEQHPRF